jgi:hypothetical protein
VEIIPYVEKSKYSKNEVVAPKEEEEEYKLLSMRTTSTATLRLATPLYVTVFKIAICYGLDGPGIHSRCGEIFRTHLDRSWGPPSLLYNGYRLFPRGKAAGAWR